MQFKKTGTLAQDFYTYDVVAKVLVYIFKNEPLALTLSI